MHVYTKSLFVCVHRCAHCASMCVCVCGSGGGAYLICGVQYAYFTIILLQEWAPPFVSFPLKRTVCSDNADVSSVYLRKCDSYSLICISISGRYSSRPLTLFLSFHQYWNRKAGPRSPKPISQKNDSKMTLALVTIGIATVPWI